MQYNSLQMDALDNFEYFGSDSYCSLRSSSSRPTNNDFEDILPDHKLTKIELIFKYSLKYNSYYYVFKLLERGDTDEDNLFRLFKILCDIPGIGSYLSDPIQCKSLVKIFGTDLISSDKYVMDKIVESILCSNMRGSSYVDHLFIDKLICFLVERGLL